MDSLVGDPLYLDQVRRNFHALKQTGSARTFAAELKTLAAILNLHPRKRAYQYREKLKGPVQTQLASLLSLDESFDSLVQKSIIVDQILFNVEKAAKKAAKSQNPNSTTNPSSRPPQAQPRAGHPPSSASRNSNAPRHAPVSSQPRSSSNPRPPLTEAEKQYREDNNLCRFCGGPHFKKDCERLKKKLERLAKKAPPPRYPPP